MALFRRPLAELEGIGNDGRRHRWEVWPDGLEVDGCRYSVRHDTIVSVSAQEATMLTEVTVEESDDEQFDWWSALAVYRHTGSIGEAACAGSIFADTTVTRHKTTRPQGGWATVFVHNLTDPEGNRHSVSFVSADPQPPVRQARAIGAALEQLVAQAPKPRRVRTRLK